MTQARALWIAVIVVLIWAGWAVVRSVQAQPDQAAVRCQRTVVSQIAHEQIAAGVDQEWEIAEVATVPTGAGYLVRVSVTARPAAGDPYTIVYVCEGAGQATTVRIGDWIE